VTTPFHFGTPTFKVAAIVSMIIVMLITAVETTGDVFACGEIVEKPVGGQDVARALRADGLATTLGGLLNSFPYTCFAENVSLVFNVWGGRGGLVSRVVPVPHRPEVLTLDQVNQMSRGRFVAEFGGLFQGPPWIAEKAYDARPFADLYELRRAFHDVLFDAPE